MGKVLPGREDTGPTRNNNTIQLKLELLLRLSSGSYPLTQSLDAPHRWLSVDKSVRRQLTHHEA